MSLSKTEVQETQIRARRDSVYLKNPGSKPIRIQSLQVGLETARFPAWEISLRTSGAVETCFGKGGGACPPASPEGRAPVSWTVAAGDSLLLFDFNLAACIRCPLQGSARNASEDSLRVPLILIGAAAEDRDTLYLHARLARLPAAGIPPPLPAPAGRSPGGG